MTNWPHHFLLLGSNHEAVESLVAGLFALRAAVPLRRRSSVYQTKAEGISVSSHYLNLAVAVECEDIDALRTMLKDIEQAAGRTAAASAIGEISLDIDLIFSTNLRQKNAEIQVHKPKMLPLSYCFAPLAEIALEYLLRMDNVPAAAQRLAILNTTPRFALASLL